MCVNCYVNLLYSRSALDIIIQNILHVALTDIGIFQMKTEQSMYIFKKAAVDKLLNSVLFLHFLTENTVQHGAVVNVNIEASNPCNISGITVDS